MGYCGFLRKPFILGIAGRSNSGKTSLILKLVPELVKRGYRVGTVKNCPHGFDIDREGKDSWKFSRVGSGGVLLTSPDRCTLIRQGEKEDTNSILESFSSFFYGFDIVLVEGFSSLQGMEKIELLRKGISTFMESSLKEVVAVVSDIEVPELPIDKPVFKPDEIDKIADFVEKAMQKDDTKKNVEVLVNDQKIFLNDFLQRMVKSLTLAIIEPLRREGKEEDIKEVIIKVRM